MMPPPPAGSRSIESIDTQSGAPASIRAALAAAKTQDAKLKLLRRYYPDAMPYEDDNFIFTDPNTMMSTVVNPEGFDIGDVAEYGRPIAETIGGGIGGAGAMLLGQMGPQVLTPEELVTVPAAVGAGTAAGGQIYDLAMRKSMNLPDEQTMGDKAKEVATDFGLGAIGQKGGEVIQTYLQGFAPWLKNAREGVAEAFRQVGVDPTAAALSGRKLIQQVETALNVMPFSGDVLGKQYQTMLDQMDTYVRGVVNSISEKSGTTAVGRSIDQGVEQFTNSFRGTAGGLYDALWAKLPKNTRVAANNFEDALGNATSQFADDPAFMGILDSNVVKQLEKAYAAGDGTIAVGTMKALRTKIGAAMDDKALLADTSQAELKRLYAALSEDIKLAADAAGALPEFKRANAYWGAGRNRIDGVLQPIVKGNTVDDIYNAVFGNEVRNLKVQSPTTIRSLMKSLPEAERKDVTAEFIRRMGMPSPGAAGTEGIEQGFSPARFMTNYNKMLKPVKSAVFGGIDGLDGAMDSLAKATSAVKDIQKMANPPGTAQQLMVMNLLTMISGAGGSLLAGAGGATGGVGAAVALTGTSYGLSKLMSSPRFINWLAKAAAEEAIAGPMSLGPMLTRLALVAEAEPAIAEEINQYAGMLREAIQVEQPQAAPQGGQPAPAASQDPQEAPPPGLLEAVQR